MAQDTKRSLLAPLPSRCQRLARLAMEHIANQVESKFRNKTWGEARVHLRFRKGELHEVEVLDSTTVRAADMNGGE